MGAAQFLLLFPHVWWRFRQSQLGFPPPPLPCNHCKKAIYGILVSRRGEIKVTFRLTYSCDFYRTYTIHQCVGFVIELSFLSENTLILNISFIYSLFLNGIKSSIFIKCFVFTKNARKEINGKNVSIISERC